MIGLLKTGSRTLSRTLYATQARHYVQSAVVEEAVNSTPPKNIKFYTFKLPLQFSSPVDESLEYTIRHEEQLLRMMSQQPGIRKGELLGVAVGGESVGRSTKGTYQLHHYVKRLNFYRQLALQLFGLPIIVQTSTSYYEVGPENMMINAGFVINCAKGRVSPLIKGSVATGVDAYPSDKVLKVGGPKLTNEFGLLFGSAICLDGYMLAEMMKVKADLFDIKIAMLSSQRDPSNSITNPPGFSDSGTKIKVFEETEEYDPQLQPSRVMVARETSSFLDFFRGKYESLPHSELSLSPEWDNSVFSVDENSQATLDATIIHETSGTTMKVKEYTRLISISKK